MRKCNNIEDVCTGVPIDLRTIILVDLDYFDFFIFREMFGYEIESSGLVKTHLSNKNNNMIDLKCGPPSISVVPSHMAGQMQGNLPKIGSGMDFSHIWTK